ncbi:MAG: hypothetical protein HQL78_01175 [Magnetococcales bacterium]|nr:hypothetical protein [Magnetococcales bacterium]
MIRASLIFLYCFLFSSQAYAILGDVAPLGSPNGEITIGDAVVAARMAVGLIPPDLNADVAPLGSPNGEITIGDAVVLARVAVGLITLSAISNATTTSTPAPTVTGTTSPVTTSTLATSTAVPDSSTTTSPASTSSTIPSTTNSGTQTPSPPPSFSTQPKIVTGYAHTVALRRDGTVWAWGNNTYGQVGDGTASNVHGPLIVYGQSINGHTHHASPFKVGITDVVDIAAGSQHTVAVKKDGSVWTWGRNDRNQLGRSSQHKDYYYQKKDGWVRSGLLSDSVTDRYSKATFQNADYGPLPVQIPELSGVIAVAAGDKHTLALKNDGTVWGWGYNDYGQLGNLTLGYADPPTILLPTKIIELSGIVAVASGDGHSLALSGSGVVFAFGKNDQAQLGRNSASGWVQRTPLQIPDLTGVTAIAASGNLTVAIKNDGNVWRSYNGFDKFSEIITGLSGATAIDVGLRDTTGLQLVNGNSDYFIALKNGTVWESSLSGTNPIHATQLSGVSAIAVGDRYVVAMKNDDTIWAWGVNDYGQLGVGTFSDQPVQQPVQAIFSSVSAVAPVSSTTTTESVSQAPLSVPAT